MGPLDGIRVLDCSTGIAGPMAVMYLADYGADVLKVEPPTGDRARTDPGFAVWNRNKRGAVLDLARYDDRAVLRERLRGAHLCVFSQPLGELEALGFDPVSVAAMNPGCVYLHMPSFTANGPGSAMPESFERLCAEAGVSAGQYSFDGGPIDPVIPHVLYGQAMWGAAAATAALLEREASGFGQVVTVGGIHGWLVTMTGAATRRPGTPHARAKGGPGGPIPFYRLYECAGGEWLFLAALTPAFHTIAFTVLGVLEELLADPRLDGSLLASALPDNSAWVIERVAREFKTRPRAEWLELISAAGCPCGPVNDRDAWFDHPQVAAMGMRHSLVDPERGEVAMPGLPITLSATPGSIRTPAPPRGGAPAGPAWPELAHTGGAAPAAAGPLAGIRVLDLGSIIAGTYAGSLLAALGADVIKVESPGGDSLRTFGPTFAGYNLGKRSLVLDLKQPDGKHAFLELVRRADVVVDNYRPGVTKRLGIDFDSLVDINPRIVTVSVTGYGDTGPLGEDPGFDPLLQAASGMMRAQGGDSDPVFFTLPVNDVASAATAALGATLALLHRARSGEGQRVTTSLAAQSIMMQCREMVRFAGREAPRIGARDYLGPAPLDRLYAVADGWVRLQADESHRPALIALGLLDAAALPGDATAASLEAHLAPWPRDEAVERLLLAGVPASPVRTLAEVAEHPQFTSEGVLQHMTLADGSAVIAGGAYARFSRTQAPPAAFIPGLGEHSQAVLQDFGFSEEEITALLASGATAIGAPFTMP
ncbi:MAG: CoA transferase [Chloroflexi bacterium]|nr:CoA transferase [Chloroflexota bacterium]